VKESRVVTASETVLFGRERELDQLRAALRDAQAGRGALVLLVGEPGIGKTRLASSFADEAASCGARVTWGRAWEAGGAPAYWPWIEALRPLVSDASAALDARIAPLAHLLPELAVGEASPATDPAQERFRLFDAVGALLAQLARERPLVVVLDDLHAADLGTLGLLHFVARGVHAARVVVVGTYRDVEARLSPDAGEAMAKIAREGRYVALDRLGRDAIAKWVAAEGHGDADSLFAATEGNPLFVVEMLRLGRDRGQLRAAATDRLPDGVRDVIRARLAQLSAPARALLDAASVLGRSVDLDLAALLSGLPLTECRDLALEAARAEVLLDARDRSSFSHILIREVLYQELAAARRAELHARVGRALAERDGVNTRASLAEATHHLFAAFPLVPADEAISWARRAAARAELRLAFDEAAELLARACAHLPSDRDAERCDLLLDLAAALGGAGQATRGRETALEAAAIARRLGDAERLAHAALRCGAAFLVAVVDRSLIGLLTEALQTLPPGDSPLRARLLARLAAALQPAPDPAQPIAMAREALAMAGRVADEPARREVLVSATSAMAYFADPRERLPLDVDLVALAERAGDRIAELRGLLRLVFDHLELGDVASADRTIDEYDRLSSAANLPMLRWRAPIFRAMRAIMDGRFDESEALCREASVVAERVDDKGAKVTLALHATGRLWAAGRIDELAAYLPVAVELVGRMADPVYTRAFRVGMLARIGRAAEARADFDALVRHDPPLRGRPMLVWAADACLALADAEAAAVLADLLTPLAHRHYNWSPLAMIMEPPIAGWVDRLRVLSGRAPTPPPAPPLLGNGARFELVLEGDVWTIRADTTFRLRDSRGLRILAELVRHPGREFHVTDLLAPQGEPGHVEDAGEALDVQAIAAYKRRLQDLRDAEAEAVSNNDAARVTRLREEIEAIGDELARGVGLGGRARRASSTAEKARVNVRQRLQDAITRIATHSPALAKHLRQALSTGTFCRYDP
jgi:hypothetical protein